MLTLLLIVCLYVAHGRQIAEFYRSPPKVNESVIESDISDFILVREFVYVLNV